ncbi:hypothetical protein KI387_037429, partial [Taxus chinensis]
ISPQKEAPEKKSRRKLKLKDEKEDESEESTPGTLMPPKDKKEPHNEDTKNDEEGLKET